MLFLLNKRLHRMRNLCKYMPDRGYHIEDKENSRTIIIRDEVIGRHPLERCEMCGRQFATTKFLKHVQELKISPGYKRTSQALPHLC